MWTAPIMYKLQKNINIFVNIEIFTFKFFCQWCQQLPLVADIMCEQPLNKLLISKKMYWRWWGEGGWGRGGTFKEEKITLLNICISQYTEHPGFSPGSILWNKAPKEEYRNYQNNPLKLYTVHVKTWPSIYGEIYPSAFWNSLRFPQERGYICQ